MRSATIFKTTESGTSSPRSISGLAFNPSGVPLATCSRSMSPVERCGMPNFLASSFAWVPFPEPGGPRKITARSSFPTGRSCSATMSSPLAAAAQTALPRKTLIVAHDELCLQLLHGVHRHAAHDQERGTAKVKLHAKSVQNPLRPTVEPVAAQPCGQVIQVDTGNH